MFLGVNRLLHPEEIPDNSDFFKGVKSSEPIPFTAYEKFYCET